MLMNATIPKCLKTTPTPKNKIEVRGSPNRDISSLRAFGPGGKQVLGVVRVARALFDVFEEK